MEVHRHRYKFRERPRPWRSNKNSTKSESCKPKQYKLGLALPMFFRLLWIYGIHLPDDGLLSPLRCNKMCEVASYILDVLCITPYVIYSLIVVDPYYSNRGSTIYWYLVKINLFTFGLSRLIIKSQMAKFSEIQTRLMAFNVEQSILHQAMGYCKRLVTFVLVAAGTSFLVLFFYFVYILVHCHILAKGDSGLPYYQPPNYDRQCTVSMWLYFVAYCLLTSLFTAICFFSFACTAFAYLCCVVLRKNLKTVTSNVVKAQTTGNVAEGFVHFCKVHSDTLILIELLDAVFSKIPLVIILVQSSSVSMVVRLPSSTYGILNEKLVACCSCTSNIAMYFIAIMWVLSASKLNQEFYSSCRVLCFVLVNHHRFLGPVWMRQKVINFLICVVFLKVKPVGITLGGYTFAEALENARVTYLFAVISKHLYLKTCLYVHTYLK